MKLPIQNWIHLDEQKLTWSSNNEASEHVTFEESVLEILKKESSIKAMKMRRFDRITQTSIYILEKLLKQTEESFSKVDRNDISLLVATGLGTLETSLSCLDKIIDNGDKYCSPMGFMNSVHNSIAANLSQIFDIQGLNMTFAQISHPLETLLCEADMLLQENPQRIIIAAVIEEIGAPLKNLLQSDQSKDCLYHTPTKDTCSFFILHNQSSSQNYFEVDQQVGSIPNTQINQLHDLPNVIQHLENKTESTFLNSASQSLLKIVQE